MLSNTTYSCQPSILMTISTEMRIFYLGKIKFFRGVLYHMGATSHMYLFKFKVTLLTFILFNSHVLCLYDSEQYRPFFSFVA